MVPPTLGSAEHTTDACPMRVRTREDGQAIVEYAMVIAGMSLVLIGFVVVTGLDQAFALLIQNIEDAFQ